MAEEFNTRKAIARIIFFLATLPFFATGVIAGMIFVPFQIGYSYTEFKISNFMSPKDDAETRP